MIVEGGDGDPGCEKKVGTGGSQGSPLLFLGVGPNKWIHMAHRNSGFSYLKWWFSMAIYGYVGLLEDEKREFSKMGVPH